MTGTTRSDPTARRRRRLALSGLLVLQAGAAAFFVVDIAADIAGAYGLGEGAAHKALEALAVLALIAGLWLTAREIGACAGGSGGSRRSSASPRAPSSSCSRSISKAGA
jgi:hypothetical protein